MITSGNCVSFCRLMLARSLFRSGRFALQSSSHTFKIEALLKQTSKRSLPHAIKHLINRHLPTVQTVSTVRCLSPSMTSSEDSIPLATAPDAIAAVAQMTASGDPDQNYSVCLGLAQVLEPLISISRHAISCQDLSNC